MSSEVGRQFVEKNGNGDLWVLVSAVSVKRVVGHSHGCACGEGDRDLKCTEIDVDGVLFVE